MPWSKLLLHEFDSVLLIRACFCVNLHGKPVIIVVFHHDQIQSLCPLPSFHLQGPPGPPGLLDLLAQVVVVMTLVLMETSTGLTSLAHQLLSDPRIIQLITTLKSQQPD